MANFQLTGIHHVTAMTSSAPKIYDFMTRILGLRLVKKTVNQDAIDTYHLYFTDDQGLPGTDLTFFDTKDVSWNVAGHHMIPGFHYGSQTMRPLNFGSSGLVIWR